MIDIRPRVGVRGRTEDKTSGEILAVDAGGGAGGDVRQAVVGDRIGRDRDCGGRLRHGAGGRRRDEHVVVGQRTGQRETGHGHRLAAAGVGRRIRAADAADLERRRGVADRQADEGRQVRVERSGHRAVVGPGADGDSADGEGDDLTREDDVVAVTARVVDSKRLAVVGEDGAAVGEARERADHRIGAVVGDDDHRLPHARRATGREGERAATEIDRADHRHDARRRGPCEAGRRGVGGTGAKGHVPGGQARFEAVDHREQAGRRGDGAGAGEPADRVRPRTESERAAVHGDGAGVGEDVVRAQGERAAGDRRPASEGVGRRQRDGAAAGLHDCAGAGEDRRDRAALQVIARTGEGADLWLTGDRGGERVGAHSPAVGIGGEVVVPRRRDGVDDLRVQAAVGIVIDGQLVPRGVIQPEERVGECSEARRRPLHVDLDPVAGTERDLPEVPVRVAACGDRAGDHGAVLGVADLGEAPREIGGEPQVADLESRGAVVVGIDLGRDGRHASGREGAAEERAAEDRAAGERHGADGVGVAGEVERAAADGDGAGVGEDVVRAQGQRSGQDRGAAGVGVRAGEREGAAAGLRDRSGATDHAGVGGRSAVAADRDRVGAKVQIAAAGEPAKSEDGSDRRTRDFQLHIVDTAAPGEAPAGLCR